MIDGARHWTPPRSSAWQRLFRPGWSDAERAFPALRRARGPGEMDRSGQRADAIAPPDGDWSEVVSAMHSSAGVVVDVVLKDSVDPLVEYPVLEPFVAPRIANRVDREDPEYGAVFESDVEGEGGYRIRYCSVKWPGRARSEANAFAAFFQAWRNAALNRLAASPVPNEDLSPTVIDPGAFAWCLGTRDRIEITLERPGGGLVLSATRAWAKRREACA